MRLLIVTQAVDREDPSLGFFHTWLGEFAKQTSHLEVICLKKGSYELPSHVHVHSLGKEGGVSRLKYVLNFYKHAWRLRHSYDSVLVHMNEEYILLGGLLWRLLGKRVGLWRNHVQGNWKVPVAVKLVHAVFYTSPQTYVAQFAHAYRMPVGVDTERFVPAATPPQAGSILSLGRIDSVKNVHILIEALELLAKEQVPFKATIIGTATPGREAYAAEVKEQSRSLEERGLVVSKPGVRFEDTPTIYASNRVFVNLTPPGSFDKTILEAAACGSLVVVSNPALKEVVDSRFFVGTLTADTTAAALKNALALTDEEFKKETATLRDYVVKEHSLKSLVTQVLSHIKHDRAS